MKKRHIKYIIVAFILIFLSSNTSNVFAALGGTGGTPGGSSTISGSGNWDWNRYGFYVAVYNSSHTQKGTTYRFGPVCVMNDTNAPICFQSCPSDLKGWITNPSENKYVPNPEKLYKYLGIPYGSTSGNYSNLLSIIDNEVEASLVPGDYIIIEPYAKITPENYVTFRNIIESSSYGTYYNVAKLVANSATVGSNITVGGHTYQAPSVACELKSSTASNRIFCGNTLTSGYYSGYGLVIVRYEDIYPYGSITITKKDESGRNISGAGFTLYSDSTCDTVKVDEKKGNPVKFDNLRPGTYYYYETTVPKGYQGNINCLQAVVTAGNDTPQTVTNKQLGRIKINKTQRNGTPMLETAFKLYRKAGDSNCGTEIISFNTGATGSYTSTWLLPGTYYLSEIIKNGYHGKPFYWNGTSYEETTTDNCHLVTITAGTTPVEINIQNKTHCEYELDNAGLVEGVDYSNRPNDKQKLLDIYIKLKDTQNNDFRNLLNFSSPSCSVANAQPELNTSCTSTTISSGTKVKLENNSEVNSTFGPNDLRQYQKILYEDDTNNKLGKNALCVVDYELNTSFLSEYNNGVKKIKAGRVIFTDNNLGFGVLKETCYAFGLTKSNSFEYDNGSADNDYDDYIYLDSGLNILNQNLISTVDTNIEYNNNSSIGVFTKTQKVNYSRVNYIEKISGFVKNDTENDNDEDDDTEIQQAITNGQNCLNNGMCIAVLGLNTRYIGYKVDGTIQNPYQFSPKVKIKEKYRTLLGTDEFVEGAKCSFEFEPELITYTNSKYKMNLEFRIIDTKNPFPGKDGKGRVIGSNWCGNLLENGVECTSKEHGFLSYTSPTISDEIKQQIINSPSSNGTCPKYTIILDSTAINKIRNYNKSHNYQEYVGKNCTTQSLGSGVTLEKDCVSKFFELSTVNIQVNDNTSCINNEPVETFTCSNVLLKIPKYGDANGDCVVNNKDLTSVYKYIENSVSLASSENADVNLDGIVNARDLQLLHQYVSDYNIKFPKDERCINQKNCGDINGDCEVSNKDLTRLFQYFKGWDVIIAAQNSDVNNDGKIDNKDLTIINQYVSNQSVSLSCPDS